MAITVPVPTEIGLLVAQQGAADVIESYRAGTLGSGMRRIVENMIDVCDATGPGAQQVADDTVSTCLERWADRERGRRHPRGGAQPHARVLHARGLAPGRWLDRSARPAPQRLTRLRRSTPPGGGGPLAGCRRR